VLRRWVWVTGLLGMIVTIAAAPALSRVTFGNSNYTFPFIWISVSLLLTQLSTGQMILLQGMRKLQYLAKANLAGSLLGLIMTLPLYYWLGINGIVPAIIISSVIAFTCAWYFGRKINVEKVKVSKARTIVEGKEMLAMGFMISISGLITLGTSYIVRIFISNHGGVAEVGLYNAGFAIVNSYVGLIFTAMATDYYPRLAAVAHNNADCSKVINQQAEISILIMAPIIIIFVVFINWVVIILYSEKFAAVNHMILWAALGMLFKAVSWAIGFIFLAKGEKKLFFFSELIANIYTLAFNVVGYYLLGLTGLGISFLVSYFLYLIQVYYLAKNKFQFSFKKEMNSIFLIQFTLAFFSFLPALILKGSISYLSGGLLFLISIIYSYRELDKRINLSVLIKNIIPNKVIRR